MGVFAQTQAGVTQRELIVYASPSWSGQRIAKIPKGRKVNVIKDASKEFYKLVSRKGTSGYVEASGVRMLTAKNQIEEIKERYLDELKSRVLAIASEYSAYS